MLRGSTLIFLARAVETMPVPPPESFARASAQCATAAYLKPSRNPARNGHCGKDAALHRCAHKHQLLQTDLVAVLNLFQRTSARLPASCRSGRPKSSPLIAHEMLKLFGCRC